MSFQMPPDPGETRRPVAPRRRRPRALLPTIAIVGALLVLFGLFTNFYTELLWFRSVDYSGVFTRLLVTKMLLFLFFGFVMAAAVAGNIVIAYRLRPSFRGMSIEQQSLDRYRTSLDPYRRIAVIVIATGLGLLAGTSAGGRWNTWMLWRNRSDFGVKDPQFNRDISFYVFSYSWYRWLLGFLFAAILLSLVASVATHYLYGGLRLQTPGQKATPAAQGHLSVLLGIFVLLKAAAYWLDRYGLAVKEGSRIVGLQYTDVNALLLAKTALAVIALICALLFFANLVRRTWLLPGIGFGLLVICAILLGGVYPAIVQQFQVKPSESDREAPFIQKNISATRDAYGLSDVRVQEYPAKVTASRGALSNDRGTIPNIRLLDPSIVSPTYKQLQQVRGYYNFPDSLDIDRYTFDGQQRDTVVAVREVDTRQIPASTRNWINDHLVYTHGFGFVGALGNTRNADGQPTFISGDIPPTGRLTIKQPRIYFGERSSNYSIVGAPSSSTPRELDFPDDASANGQKNTTYEGKGGVPIGSFFNKLLYAMKFQEQKILLSNGLNSDSRVLYHREPRDRVEKVAPWLTLDGDPYPTVVDGRIVWVVDGYTTSNDYPYSARETLERATVDTLTTRTNSVVAAPPEKVNYIRNSVKATVDAYDGTVTLYEWDTKDPVLKAWESAFPGTVQPKSQISPDLLKHLRYPEDMFKVQRDLLARYHVTDPQAFYGGQDFWRIPKDPTTTSVLADQPPYYLTLQMPGQKRPTFSLTSTYVPTGTRENLAAFMAVDADPGPGYGEIRVLQLPRSQVVNGPRQVQNAFSSSSDVATYINLLRRGDSDVEFGNLLTLPVGGGLLYVEPVYVRASSGTSFPLLRKVLVQFGDRIGFEDTLQQGLDKVFKGESGTKTNEPSTGGTGTTTGGGGGGSGGGGTSGGTTGPSKALTQALAAAQKAFTDGQAALRRGDFQAYGEAQQRLASALRRAAAAQSQATAPSRTPSSSRSPSPSPSQSP